jgi:hypothetical protein
MKVIKIQGGLGNQLFGVAFARSAAILDEGPVGLDLSSYDRDPFGRGFELKDFVRGLGALALTHKPWSGARATHIASRLAPLPGFVREGRAPRDPAALRALIARGTYFSGYWQNEAYIADAARLRAQVRRFVEAKAPRGPAGAVVIHYRTYKEERRAKARRTPTASYFVNALSLIERQSGPVSEVAVVSDDPALARSRLADLGWPLVGFEAESPWDDLALMARARALVLTNSSFSWWGGWASDAQCVVYPRSDRYVHYPRPAERFVRL